MQTFRSAEYLARFRIAARQRGIDPLLGATAYQAVHIAAPLCVHHPIAITPSTFFAPGSCAGRPTEAAALDNLRRQASGRWASMRQVLPKPLQLPLPLPQAG